MLMTVVIWSWYYTNRILTSKCERSDLFRAAIAGLVLSYTHGVGPLINAYIEAVWANADSTEAVPKKSGGVAENGGHRGGD